MKENRKLLKEVLKDIRHDMSDEEVLNLLADSKISVSPESEKEKYTLGQRAADVIAKFTGSWAFIFCRLGTACNARCPQMVSPQKGSWRRPAQGCKTSSGRLPCTDRSGAETAQRPLFDLEQTMTAENHSPPARSLRRTQCTNLWVVYNCALSKLRGFRLLLFQQFFQ